MSCLNEAISRYHDLITSGPYQDLAWADNLQERMREHRLTESGRLVSPLLRPYFISKDQHVALTQSAVRMWSVLNQIEQIVINTPALLHRVHLLPVERMLASTEPGYPWFSVTLLIRSHVNNGSLRVSSVSAGTPAGVAFGDSLSHLFLDVPILHDLRRQGFHVTKSGESHPLCDSISSAWKQFGGKNVPSVALVELRTATGESHESSLLAEILEQNGLETRVVSPEDLEYRNGRLCAGSFEIDVVYRRISTQNLLARHDLSHPLLTAYRQHAVCVINSFRSDMTHRRAFFDLLSDDSVTQILSNSDRKFLKDAVPWTRYMIAAKTIHGGKPVDLPTFVLENRERLVLMPNDDASEAQTYVGANLTQAAWEHAVRLALSMSYVVQERVEATRQIFPVYQYGDVQMKELDGVVNPHAYVENTDGASAVLSSARDGFALPVALAPVFLVEKE